MKQAFYESALGIGLATALFSGGMALGTALSRMPAAPGDAATWVGAFLAALAFGGTIWLATTERRNRHRIEDATARLVAVSMLQRIGFALGVVEAIGRQLATANVRSHDLEYFKQAAIRLDGITWSVSEVLPMVHLRGTLATDLVQASDDIDATRNALSKSDQIPELRDEVKRRAFALGLSGVLGNVTLRLQRSHKETFRLVDEMHDSQKLRPDASA